MNKIIEITKSDSFVSSDVVYMERVLNRTVNDYLGENDEIINIERKEENGSERFWIYTIKRI